MPSLRQLVERLEEGYYLAWKASKGKSRERTRPKVVKNIEERGKEIEVQAEGSGEGSYSFTVDEAGNSESFYYPPSEDERLALGPIIFAERTDSQEFVAVKRGYYDNK